MSSCRPQQKNTIAPLHGKAGGRRASLPLSGSTDLERRSYTAVSESPTLEDELARFEEMGLGM